MICLFWLRRCCCCCSAGSGFSCLARGGRLGWPPASTTSSAGHRDATVVAVVSQPRLQFPSVYACRGLLRGSTQAFCWKKDGLCRASPEHENHAVRTRLQRRRGRQHT